MGWRMYEWGVHMKPLRKILYILFENVSQMEVLVTLISLL